MSDIRINNAHEFIVQMIEDYQASEGCHSKGSAAAALIAIGFYHWSFQETDKGFIGGSGDIETALWEQFNAQTAESDFLTWLIKEILPNSWGGKRK